jgi:hypothetical protein
VDQSLPLSHESEPADRVRALGIDPGLLSPDEQVEIIDIHSACSNEALDQGRESEID